jgi:hypothetical protein
MNRKNDDRSDKIAGFRPHGGPYDERGELIERAHGNGQLRQKLPPEVHAFLGHRLRTAYSDLINEPIPRPLLDLLDRLKAQEFEAESKGVQDTNEAKEKA